jgi:hypothetical protein
MNLHHPWWLVNWNFYWATGRGFTDGRNGGNQVRHPDEPAFGYAAVAAHNVVPISVTVPHCP